MKKRHSAPISWSLPISHVENICTSLDHRLQYEKVRLPASLKD